MIQTTVLQDATRAVDPKTEIIAIGELKKAGVKLMNSTDLSGASALVLTASAALIAASLM
jgi:hypothetical protein